jgi:DNA-binding IclR family transcriptional regulator
MHENIIKTQPRTAFVNGVLRGIAGDSEYVTITISEIGSLAGVNRHSAKKHMSRLIDHGMIRKVGEREYQLL